MLSPHSKTLARGSGAVGESEAANARPVWGVPRGGGEGGEFLDMIHMICRIPEREEKLA